MLKVGVRIDAAEGPPSHDRTRSAGAMADLFAPLADLLRCGGDPRLDIDPATGANEYGCHPFPRPEGLSFSSSTATSISERGYRRAATAREQLMQSAIAIGIDAAFDERIEAMRDELKSCLGLPADSVDVVFSPSGTDSQLQALFVARALLGPALTTVIVAADQTGSGTVYTARGTHFSARTAHGGAVRKGTPVAGLAVPMTSIGCRCSMTPAGFVRKPGPIARWSRPSKARLPAAPMCFFRSWIHRSSAGARPARLPR